MGAIPADCEPAPIIHAYVDLNVQTLASAGLIAAPARDPAGHADGARQQVAPRGVRRELPELLLVPPQRQSGAALPYAHARPRSAPAAQGRGGGGGEAHGGAAAPAQPPAPLAAIATVATAASPRARPAEAQAPPAASPRVAGPPACLATWASHMRLGLLTCDVRLHQAAWRCCLLSAVSALQESSKWALGEIFKKIGDKATTEQARCPTASPALTGMRTRAPAGERAPPRRACWTCSCSCASGRTSTCRRTSPRRRRSSETTSRRGSRRWAAAPGLLPVRALLTLRVNPAGLHMALRCALRRLTASHARRWSSACWPRRGKHSWQPDRRPTADARLQWGTSPVLHFSVRHGQGSSNARVACVVFASKVSLQPHSDVAQWQCLLAQVWWKPINVWKSRCNIAALRSACCPVHVGLCTALRGRPFSRSHMLLQMP